MPAFDFPTSPVSGQIYSENSNSWKYNGIYWAPFTLIGKVDNPTVKVGLTPINGIADSAIRSDGAPALDQGISPNWSGVHTFGSGLARMTSPRIATSITDLNGNPWIQQVATPSAIFGASITNAAIGGTVKIETTTPEQSSSSTNGTSLLISASNAVAGNSIAGAAAGGSVSIIGGNATRLSTGAANGGSINLTGGSPQGQPGIGGSINITGGSGLNTLADRTDAGGNVNITGGINNGNGGNVTITGGTNSSGNSGGVVSIIGGFGASPNGVIILTPAASNNGNVTPSISISTGAAIAGPNSNPQSTTGSITFAIGNIGISSAASGTGATPGSFSINLGKGGTQSGGTLAIGGNGSAYNIIGGAGGDATGTSGTQTGGTGSTLVCTAGNGGNAVSASGTRTGGTGGAITFTTGNGGNGSTTNGNSGALTLATGTAGAGAGTAGIIGNILLRPGGVTALTVGRSIIADTTIRLKGYTVATLPVSPTQGDTAFVTDATSPSYLSIIVGGGSVVTPVFYNGTNWVAH
jgi:hypothetical protein